MRETHGSRMGRLFHCGEQLRGSESGNLERFTVSLTSISLFLGVCFVFGVVVCVLFVGFLCCFVFLVLFPPTMLRSVGGKGENRLWKRVAPTVTEFAWLPPNIAESFCRNALYRKTARTYHAFDTPHLGLDTPQFVADMRVEDILYLGDARSADDLAVFTGMAPERLCLRCGLRVEEPFAPLATGERSKLFNAAQKLLMFVLHDVSAQTSSQEEAALRLALRPLIVNRDGHFVAAVTTMFQSLLEGKTDCPISGVFGAGKTLSAAAMIAGLLVMDPSLKIMIVTKENVAAHAFAKHFLRLGLLVAPPPGLDQPSYSVASGRKHRID